MSSSRFGVNSVRSCAATSLRSFESCGLVCNSAALVCSTTLTITGSNIAAPPLVSTSSRAVAAADAEGACACAWVMPSRQMSAATGARRTVLAIMGQSFLLVSGPLDDAPAFRSGDHGRMSEPDEKPVFDDSRDGRQPLLQRARIGDPLYRGLEDE